MSIINESHLLHQTRCPKCTEEGHDKSGDNLGVYSDGHSYCFRCGYFSNGDGIYRLIHSPEAIETHKVILPYDSSLEYPQQALDWIGQYELNRNDLLSNNAVWSESKKRLYFPIYGDEGLLAYQGRYFGDDKDQKKWWGKGDFKNIFGFYGTAGRSLVCVEDVISAIKLSRITQSWWLSGNSIGIKRFQMLFKIVPRGLPCIIWLDPDMDSQAIKQASLGASCGINTRVIFSDKDPKETQFTHIKELLNGNAL